MNRAFSACSEAVDIPGALPQAFNETAPSALKGYSNLGEDAGR
jgi:hypothetical protein